MYDAFIKRKGKENIKAKQNQICVHSVYSVYISNGLGMFRIPPIDYYAPSVIGVSDRIQ